jgi:hypothetical protein
MALHLGFLRFILFLRRYGSVDCSIRILFPAFFPSILKVLKELDFHNRRSLTGGKEASHSSAAA